MTETVADRRLHPATLAIRFLRRAPEFVLGLPALVGFASDASFRRILLIAALGAAISLAGSLLAWLRFRYGVSERDVVIESGILHRQRRIIPFDRIQDVDIEQGLLARLFGTAKVRIETGGGGKDEGTLDAVALTEAHRIRDVVRGFGPAGAEGAIARPAEAEEPVLFAMPFPRLILAGLFNFSLVYLAVIGGALQYFDSYIERSIGDPRQWVEPTREKAAGIGLSLSLALVGVLILLGILTGVFRTIARDYRFQLLRGPSGFRRRRGLFTLSEAVIPLRRVQVAIVGSGWVMERFGWFDLSFQTLGASPQGSGHQDAAPFARMEEIEPILAEAGMPPLPSDEAFRRTSKRTILRRSLNSLAPLALISIAVSFFWRESLILLLPVAAAVALLAIQWRRHRYAVTDEALYVSRGFFRPRLRIMPFEKAQTISVSRSPLQRRLGLATLSVDTAGASIFQDLAILDLEKDEAEALGGRLLRDFHQARAMQTAPEACNAVRTEGARRLP